jgi:hypothetical protein
MSNCVIVYQFELTKMWVAGVEVGMHLHGAENLLLMHATYMIHHLLL